MSGTRGSEGLGRREVGITRPATATATGELRAATILGELQGFIEKGKKKGVFWGPLSS